MIHSRWSASKCKSGFGFTEQEIQKFANVKSKRIPFPKLARPRPLRTKQAIHRVRMVRFLAVVLHCAGLGPTNCSAELVL